MGVKRGSRAMRYILPHVPPPSTCKPVRCIQPNRNINGNITSFYESSCANNGKGALNPPEAI
eukprot:2291910-Pyramimonas_sp.AAC.1